ncbi:MAG: TraR/DksA C4-type zinc finger protein [Pseudomonadota bacterium]
MDDDARHLKARLSGGDEEDAIARKTRASLTVVKDDAVVLTEIEEALDRLDGGSFGYCTECGKPIDILRLAHDPTISRCLSCVKPSDKPN